MSIFSPLTLIALAGDARISGKAGTWLRDGWASKRPNISSSRVLGAFLIMFRLLNYRNLVVSLMAEILRRPNTRTAKEVLTARLPPTVREFPEANGIVVHVALRSGCDPSITRKRISPEMDAAMVRKVLQGRP